MRTLSKLPKLMSPCPAVKQPLLRGTFRSHVKQLPSGSEPVSPPEKGTEALLRLNSVQLERKHPNSLCNWTDGHVCGHLRPQRDQQQGERRDPRGEGERVAQSRRQSRTGLCRCGQRPLEAGGGRRSGVFSTNFNVGGRQASHKATVSLGEKLLHEG